MMFMYSIFAIAHLAVVLFVTIVVPDAKTAATGRDGAAATIADAGVVAGDVADLTAGADDLLVLDAHCVYDGFLICFLHIVCIFV